MEILTTLNQAINELSELTSLKIVAVDKVQEKPHPFCIGNKHIKRYFLDVHAGPCRMRINPDDSTKWANKRVAKEGIVGTCELSFDEHTFDRMILIELTTNIKAKILNDALSPKGKLKAIFDNYSITGFNFIRTDPQYHLT